MEELLNKLFNKLEGAKMYIPMYSYDIEIANQIIRSFFEDELSKFCQHDVSRELVCTCGKSAFKEMEEGKSIHSVCGKHF